MSVSISIRHNWPTFSLAADLTMPMGITAIFGRSGSGKTSLINAVAGIFTPDEGRIDIGGAVVLDTKNGINTPTHRRDIGYVFQDARLFPHMSVQDNLRYAARHGRARSNAAREDEIITLLGIDGLLNRRIATLSGGEKQRVTIGRALLSDPKILLMDEPLSALDAPRKAEIMPYLERIRQAVNIPILYVSHSISEVARLAHHMVVLDQGRVIAAGPTQSILSDPALVPILGVRSAGASIVARIAAHDSDGLTQLSTSAGVIYVPKLSGDIGHSVRVRILAQDVTIALSRPHDISALNILPSVITDIRIGDGPGAIVLLRSGDDTILARITKRSVTQLGLTTGMSCYAVVKSVSVGPSDIG
jgi:molybdate transport system ATP-binding protein